MYLSELWSNFKKSTSPSLLTDSTVCPQMLLCLPLRPCLDFLLNNDLQKQEVKPNPAAVDCFNFIRESGYFFLATSVQDTPKLRPMGFIYADDRFLYISTDKRKRVYCDLVKNPKVELASYNLNTRRWIRISGVVEEETSGVIRDKMISLYPMIRQEFVHQDQIYFVMFRFQIESVLID